MKHAIYIGGENIERVVRDIDYKILCDGRQYGLITHKKEEVIVCRPRNVQGEGYGHWISEDKFQSEQEMQALDQAVDPDGMGPEGQQAWNAFQREQALEPTWQERERLNDQERLAYCGYEEF